MKYLIVLIALGLLACSKETPEPVLSSDTKAERAATMDSFVGEWIYVISETPVEKIVIEKTGTTYSFKHYEMMAGRYVLDTIKYYAQDLQPGKFIPWDKSTTYRPYFVITSSYSDGKGYLTYRMISGQQHLELGLSKYKKN